MLTPLKSSLNSLCSSSKRVRISICSHIERITIENDYIIDRWIIETQISGNRWSYEWVLAEYFSKQSLFIIQKCIVQIYPTMVPTADVSYFNLLKTRVPKIRNYSVRYLLPENRMKFKALIGNYCTLNLLLRGLYINKVLVQWQI